jgi:mRNA interferase MazF
MKSLNKFEIWLANLDPGRGTDPGKTRPVIIVQTDFLNEVFHPSTLVCPLTSQIKQGAEPLRIDVHHPALDQKSQVMVDQIRAIDNRRLLRSIGMLSESEARQLNDYLKLVLDLG